MIIGFGNNVVSSLAADITAIQTTIQVMPGAGAMFANLLTSDYANSSNPLKTYAKITLTDAKETVFEVCHLTAVNNDMLTVIRGQEGTTAKGWSLNDVIANFATRGSENQFVQIEELQSGHYVAGVAGGTENNLTLELPATYFVNGGADWTLRTPLVVIPALNNTGASTLQLTMGGRVLGIFPLYKGNKSELSASDIIKDVPVLCVLDNTKTYFSVLNPLEIYLGSRYLQKDQNLSDVPDKALARQSLQLGNSATLNVGTTANTVAAGNDSRITGAMQKDQNGADIPDKPGFIKNVGLKETLNPTKRVSIGNIGTGAFDGSTPSINIGDSDSGFIGSADGVLDIYCNNAKVGYIDNAGLHMLAGIATNGNVVLQNDAREHIIIQNADGSARAYIYKDKDDTGIHINNGADGSGDFVLGKDSVLYVPFAVRAGGSKKLAIQSDNNSTQSATFNLWGDANRPTVIELDDDQGWHLFSQRNTDGSILFEVNGRIMAHTALHSGDATLATDGNVYGTIWGGWLNDWINNNLVRAVRLGPVALSGGLWRDFQLGGGQVVTGFHTDGDWEMQGGDDKVYYRPIQYLIGTQWVTAPSA
ncbi:phage tail protein [Salmonella enterica subsp. diarizonae]|nr:phage tail protein [Salmonella enterica subsp. diarizonae]ECR4176228.1 phage tail protein [Salmonella enterica]ECE6626482.1 phage tail protein [Salmonella enterica subsp. diarizonae]ECI3670090.1 phage tail protein [Salmonella enterica subsp. diarizonae]ECJ2511810.1 phage tail protein [Salmonella enterica subsp. diarizonae]